MLPNIKFATIAACPVFGGKVANANETAALKVAGVRQVVVFEDFAAVVGDHTWAAKQGLKALAIEWDEGPNASLNTRTIWAGIRDASKKDGVVAKAEGDPVKAPAGGATHDAAYEVPFLAHATMEPMNCTADLREGSCDIYVGTQVVYQGQNGPLSVSRVRSDNPMQRTFLQAATEAQFPVNEDFNGAEQEGLGVFQVTQFKGERWSAARGYIQSPTKEAKMAAEDLSEVKALLFDVFGTVVDWRSSLIADFRKWSERRGVQADWVNLVDAWRDSYAPSLNEVRQNPSLGFRKLDALNREGLEKIVKQFGIRGLTEDDMQYLVKGWHRLDPWADSVPGLKRLKSRFTIAPLSNGNVSLLTAMAKHADLPWDLVLSGELYAHYKPDPGVYVGAVKTLDLEPGQVMMVAAHNFDLAAAQKLGLKTAFVLRPTEMGPSQTTDLKPDGNWNIVVKSIGEIAEKLGA